MTPRRLAILRYIDATIRQTQCAPTFDQIAAEFGRSKITVFEHVERLIHDGLLKRLSRDTARSLRVTDAGRAAIVGGAETLQQECAAMLDKAFALGKGKSVRSALGRLLATK